jgi:hypothetical protein
MIKILQTKKKIKIKKEKMIDYNGPRYLAVAPTPPFAHVAHSLKIASI